MPDHYTVLGVARLSTSQEIKAAYRRLVAQYHPDLNPDAQASEITAALNEAYAVLCDEEKRKAYDAELEAESPWRLAGPRSGGPASRPPVPACCQHCGRQDSTLRFSEFSYTLSCVVVLRRGRARGVWCQRCGVAEAAKWSLLSGFAGWWGIPWGPVRTIQDLAANGRGGQQPASRNAALLRSVGYECYSRGDYGEARRALRASLGFRPDAEATALLDQMQSRLPPRAAAPAAWPWNLALAGPAVIVVAVWAGLIYATVSRLALRPRRPAPAEAAVASTRAYAELPSREMVNVELTHLARLIALRSHQVGTHYDGSTLVTNYALDRSRYQAEELYAIARLIGSARMQGGSGADRFFERAYFNSMLFALSVDTVNRVYQGQPIAAPSAEVETLGRDPRLAAWLRAYPLWSGYQALERTLSASAARYRPGRSVLEMETEAERVQSALQQLDSQQELFQAEQYTAGYNRLVPVYNRNLMRLKLLSKQIQTQLGVADALDAAFNRSLDASLLLGKFEAVTFTSSAAKTRP